ncbi:uncharacterized protein LOC120653411 [Panicum virgatum]|uniref:uncharacterized protein LOC120653411 n=1 Tax=Panicum virgatum TaxID=38727 RepID=UPI0019D57AB7|nr:uncharacterized protein LOC120653411 [Panicum virgatum]
MDRDLSGLRVSTPAQQFLLPAGNGFFTSSLSCPSAHGYGIRSCEVTGRLGHFKLCIYPLTRGYTSKLTIRGSYAEGREDMALKALVRQRDSETVVTVPFWLQAIPSHWQQSVPCQSLARSASCESSVRNWRRGGHLQLCAGTGAGRQGDAQHKGKANGRYVRSDAVLLAARLGLRPPRTARQKPAAR